MAAGAAVAVAVAGRGDLVLLGALLALALAERRSSVAALLAVTAVAVRWGTTSLEAISGATTTLVYSVYVNAFAFGNSNFGLASAQAMVLFVVVLAVTTVQFGVLERRVFYR